MANGTRIDEERLTLLAGEILTLGILGKLLYQYPDREFYEHLFKEGILEDIPLDMNTSLTEGIDLIQKWTSDNASLEEAGWFEALLADYTRLFIGPDKVLAPPWESVFVQEGRLVFTETTLEVRHWYRRFGLEVENLHKEPDDHIGLELAFIANLANRAIQALEAGQPAEYERYMQARIDFYAAHLGKWAIQYFDQLYDYARTDFYHGLARLGRGVMIALEASFEKTLSR